MFVCTLLCSDTKEYPLKLSGYSRVQIPCTPARVYTFMYPWVHWLVVSLKPTLELHP